MKKVMKHLCALALLTMISSVASAEVVVNIEESYDGGSVTVKGQSEPAEDGSVEVTITVTPETGYYIAKSDIQVILTYAGDYSTTREGAPQIGDKEGLPPVQSVSFLIFFVPFCPQQNSHLVA